MVLPLSNREESLRRILLDLYTQNVVINMDDQEDLHRASLEGKSAKERPIWLRESTVQGAYSSEEMKEGKSRS